MNSTEMERLLLTNPLLESSVTENSKENMELITNHNTGNSKLSISCDLTEASTSTSTGMPIWTDGPNYEDEAPSKKKCQTVIQDVQMVNGSEATVRTLKGHRQRIENLHKELNWTTAIMHEKYLEALKKEKGQLQVQVPGLINALQVNAIKINQAKERFCKILEISKGKSTKIDYSKAKRKLSLCKTDYETKLKEYKYITMKIESQEQDVDIFSLRGNTEKSQEGLVEQIASQESQCNELSERIQEVGLNYSTAYKLDLSLRSDIKWNKHHLQSVCDKIVVLENEINCLKGNSFFDDTSKDFDLLMQNIELGIKNKSFKKTPLGPVGHYVTIKDDFWAPAIRTYLSSVLSCFCVDNWDDYNYLLGILKTVFGTRPKPMIIISDFYTTVHDVSEHAVRPPEGMYCMMDILSINNPVIANCLIDKMEVERMLLVPSSTEARELMNSLVLPPNIKAALTAEGIEYYPANQRASRANLSEEIQLKEEEVESYEHYKSCVDVEMCRLNKVLQENYLEVVKFEEERKEIQQTLLNKRANLNELKSSLLPNSTPHAKAEYCDAVAELLKLKKEREELFAECILAKEGMIEGKKSVVALRDMMFTFCNKDALMLEKRKVRKELKKLEVEKTCNAQSLLALENQIKTVISCIANQQVLTNESVSLARNGSKYRIMSKRKIEEIQHEIKTLKKVVAILSKK